MKIETFKSKKAHKYLSEIAELENKTIDELTNELATAALWGLCKKIKIPEIRYLIKVISLYIERIQK